MKILFIFLFFVVPLAARAAEASSAPDYFRASVAYGSSLLIIIFFAVGGFLASRFVKRKLDEYNKKLEERHRKGLAEKKLNAWAGLERGDQEPAKPFLPEKDE